LHITKVLRFLLAGACLYLIALAPAVNAQDCPPNFGNGKLCTAKDFTVTSAVISGPDECTDGETISITLRVGLESTAQQRYDIGFFVGDGGGQVIGGPSCTHSSLAPIEPNPPFNANSGVGGYRDLEGDACGDMQTSDGIVFHDIQLESVLCRDSDGDGQVDISALLTWSSNANQDVCTNPDLPSNFFPLSSSKCVLAPDFNIPIIVEPAPTMTVDKLALPASLPAPGGPVTFTVSIQNSSAATDPLTITSLVDDVHGNLNGRGTCSVPQNLAPGQSYLCQFTETVSGSAGYAETDTITVTAQDNEGEVLVEMASATVVIESVPPSILVRKAVSPSTLPEPGGTVTYFVLVANSSHSEGVTLTALDDDLYGDVFDRGTCPSAGTILAAGEFFLCRFDEVISAAQPGDTITDTVTATAEDSGNNSLSDSDTATVTITDVAAEIQTIKYAIPRQLPEPGGTFTFHWAVQNTSPVDTVIIDTIVDDIYGDLTAISGSTCTIPQILQPAEIYQCAFPGDFTGSPGEFQVDTITVTATSDDGQTETDTARAMVSITDVPATIEVIKTASPTQVESGTTVTFSVAVVNTSQIDTVTLNTLDDDIYGDITTTSGSLLATTCSVSQVLNPSENYQCQFQAIVTGPIGATVTDVVTADGVDNSSNPVTNSDDADVVIVDVAVPTPPLKVSKVAVPATIAEPGGTITYLVLVENNSIGDLRITSLLDDIYDLQGNDGSKEPIDSQIGCTPGFVLAAGGKRLCLFRAPVNGAAGDTVTDTITAKACEGSSCTGSSLTASDDATVSITAGSSSIVVQKTASPTTVTAPGGAVTFTVEVINSSASAAVTITSLLDSIYGDITTTAGNIDSTSCSTPQTIAAAGGSYQCSFTAQVTGVAGDEEINLVVASGQDDASTPVSGSDTAEVSIRGIPPAVVVTKTASPHLVKAPGGPVTFTVSVQNTSATEGLRVNTLIDDIFGDLHGQGNCQLPQVLTSGQVYSCDFIGTVSGAVASLHVDTITASATDDSGDVLTAKDSAYVFIFVKNIADALEIPVSSALWLLLTSLLVSVAGLRTLRRRFRGNH